MSDDLLRFAIVGCGTIAPTHAQVLTALKAEGASLAAFADEVPERADAMAAQFGAKALSFEAVLADPTIDAVTLCIPSGLHAELGVRALRAGKHVVVEKPMDVSLAACDRLLAAQRESGKRLAVISQHRFDHASTVIKAALEHGLLGSMVYAEARVPWYRTQEYYDSGDWRGTWALDGGGALMNQGVHTADLMRWFCGPVETVYAQARTLAHARIETEDVIAATLTFANGAVGTLSASTALYPGFAVRLGVYGTEGSAIMEGDMLHTLTTKSGTSSGGEAAQAHALQVATGGTKAASEHTEAASAASDPAAIWGEAHRTQLADFIQCCRTGADPIVDGTEGRKAVEVVLAVYESARTGEVIRL
ncbi:MAG: Gfo/Idh/MocA family protein [Janthinobacterium lividum]